MSQGLPSVTVVIALTALLMLGASASDSVVPIIPAIAAGAGVSVSQAQLIFTCFIGGYCFGQIPSGYLADSFGRIPVIYIGMSLFCLGSVLCFAAEEFNTLLAARFLQGMGASAGAVISRTISRDLYSGVELARLLSVLGAALSSMTVFAPLIGGLIASYANWNWLFMFLLLQGLITILAAFLWLEETHPELRDGGNGQARQKLLPLMDCLRLFIASRQSVWGTFMLALSFFGFVSILSTFGSIVIEVYGYSMSFAGPLLSSGILFFVAANIFSHRLVMRMGSIRLVGTAVALFATSAIGFAALYLLQLQGIFWFWLPSILYFAGMGLMFPNISSITLSPLPKVAGFASSILGTAQTFLAFWAAMLSGILYRQTVDNVVVLVSITATLLLILFAIKPRIDG